jgi:hypothetical protein
MIDIEEKNKFVLLARVCEIALFLGIAIQCSNVILNGFKTKIKMASKERRFLFCVHICCHGKKT